MCLSDLEISVISEVTTLKEVLQDEGGNMEEIESVLAQMKLAQSRKDFADLVRQACGILERSFGSTHHKLFSRDVQWYRGVQA